MRAAMSGLCLLLFLPAVGAATPVVVIPADATVYADLDGDRMLDTVSVRFTQSGHTYEPFTVTVNGLQLSNDGAGLERTFSIVDIDSRDAFLEIAVPEEGPSDDYATHYIWFDGDSLRYMDLVPAGAEGVDGSGAIHGGERGQLLQTWWYSADFRLTAEHRLVRVERPYYDMNTPVRLLADVPLYREPRDSAPHDTAHAGASGMIARTDDKEWCELRLVDGPWGWFRVEGCCRVGGRSAFEVFAGLCNAD